MISHQEAQASYGKEDFKLIWLAVPAKIKHAIGSAFYRDEVAKLRARIIAEAEYGERMQYAEDVAAISMALSLGMPKTNRIEDRLRPGITFTMGSLECVVEALRCGAGTVWYALWRCGERVGVAPVKTVLKSRRDLWFMATLEKADPSPAVRL